MELEQRIYRNAELEAQKNMLNSFPLVGRERGRREEVWTGKKLLLFYCLMKKENGGSKTAFVRYMEYVASLNGVNEALKCVCLQWVFSSTGEEGDDIR